MSRGAARPPRPSSRRARKETVPVGPGLVESRWIAKNRAAIDQYNAVVAKRGVFGDTWRKF
jgi:hypothetical protein